MKMPDIKNNLKPCPFCGKEVGLTTFEVNDPFTFIDFGYEIFCEHCHIGFKKSIRRLPGLNGEDDDNAKQWLIDTWNTRFVPETAKHDRL